MHVGGRLIQIISFRICLDLEFFFLHGLIFQFHAVKGCGNLCGENEGRKSMLPGECKKQQQHTQVCCCNK